LEKKADFLFLEKIIFTSVMGDESAISACCLLHTRPEMCKLATLTSPTKPVS